MFCGQAQFEVRGKLDQREQAHVNSNSSIGKEQSLRGFVVAARIDKGKAQACLASNLKNN